MTRIRRAPFGTHIVFATDQNSGQMKINTKKTMELEVSEDPSLATAEDPLLLLNMHVFLRRLMVVKRSPNDEWLSIRGHDS